MAKRCKAKRKLRQFGNSRSGTANLSLAEIGKMFGVSLQAVQGVEQRALRKIRQAIEAEAERAGLTPQEWLFGDEDYPT